MKGCDLYKGRLSMVTHLFPTPYFHESGAFNANLALEFARQGLKVNVVACFGIIRPWWDSLWQKPIQAWDFYPIVVTPAGFLALGRWFPASKRLRGVVTQYSLQKKVELTLSRQRVENEVVYAIFSASAIACLRWCQQMGVPLFAELPESRLESCLLMHGREAMQRLVHGCQGIVANSVDNLKFCIDLAPSCEEKIVYIPNAVDTQRFRKMDKSQTRRKLGLPEKEIIVVFCGHFIHRKGPLRVLKALQLTGDIKGVFLGRGPQVPKGPLVLHAAPVPNTEMPLWMNAGDIFVLPSLAEGLANVIVEAMACGLPLIVSDRSFNRNFLTEKCAVFVDPESPRDIANAIKVLLNDNSRRMSMSKHVLEESKKYSINRRVKKIRNFIERQMTG